ncbi:hypothetical protein LCGC14_0987810 [marine sediment metagenome]|uniref:Uncharacterized protein n=1 Tax=marine sediment metagenome TaxID=412755 RepID=A0A0F9NTD6_9ZZZZ
MGGIVESNERINLKYEETINQQRIPSAQGMIGATPYFTSKVTPLLGVVGIANINGTEILEINIPAGMVFACNLLQYACNEGRQIGVCTVPDAGVLGDGDQAEIYVFGDDNVGLHAIKGEEQPIFIINNSGSTVDIEMLVYAPATVFNITNDPATSYFQAYVAGILYRGNVTTRGIV